MIKDIGNILIGKINTLPFIDKYAGVVQTLSYKETKENGTIIKKSFPIACTKTLEQCQAGDYFDLVPDSSKKSVFYLEDKGIRFVKKDAGKYYFKAVLDLVGWLNLKKLGFTGCSYASIAMISILSKIPSVPKNEGIYQRLLITPLGEGSKQNNPFSKYSYDETVNQYLMYPFDYFVLPFDVDFFINKDCLTVEPINPEIPC